MPVLRYIVGVTLPDQTTADRWLAWLRDGHIAEVMAGGATSATIIQFTEPPLTFEIDYRFPSAATFAEYERDHAPRLRAEGRQSFPPENGIVYRRTTATIIDEFGVQP